MISSTLPQLCGVESCRRLVGHSGNHNPYPTEAWAFMAEADKNKLTKAGFATPRGGHKAGYQNHVVRSNQVIIPFELLDAVILEQYKDGYVIRLRPHQYFELPGVPKPAFREGGEYSWIVVGGNAYVLYRTHEELESFPPMEGWEVRGLMRDGQRVTTRRGDVTDTGHYLLRVSRIGDRGKMDEGPPQGIFAPEYTDKETNYLSRCVLAWLIVHAVGSPYTTTQANWLRAIMDAEDLLDIERYEHKGVIRRGFCQCPLCLRFIRYEELHRTLSFDEASGLMNAPEQVEWATRSTIVNLFHLEPLTYHPLGHTPSNVAWGHAHCNTRLGQRRCFSLDEIIDTGNKVGIITSGGIETFGWISDDWEMIRSPLGSVWIRINEDTREQAPPE
jgi:hypothetical protein